MTIRTTFFSHNNNNTPTYDPPNNHLFVRLASENLHQGQQRQRGTHRRHRY